MSTTVRKTKLAGQLSPVRWEPRPLEAPTSAIQPTEVRPSVDSGTSPYVGPKSFSREDAPLFFGREAEAVDLKYQVMAEPVTLLYAMSGAGKTSLINARLIPSLQEDGCRVLPVGRVRGSIRGLDPAEIPDIFVHHVLSSWASASQSDSTAPAPGTTLLRGLERLAAEGDSNCDLFVAVIDQFEELFTSYPSRWDDRGDFLKQLARAVQGIPNLRVLLSMREDFLASTDPYVRYFPDRLGSRFRLEQLRHDAALKAVTGPLNGTGYSFAPDIAEQLVENLMRIRIRSIAGSPHKSSSVDVDIDSCQGSSSDPDLCELLKSRSGIEENGHVEAEFIEPVQLQVVCQKLWEGLGPQDRVITSTHLETLGDVDLALADFYSKCACAAAAATGIREAVVRRWFEDVMITPYRTRGMIIRGADLTGKLPNAAVDFLDSQHLIRSEDRGGARWYELTHDRFIDPILDSNRRWRAERSSKSLDELEQRARALEQAPEANRSAMLLTEEELHRAKALVAEPDALALGTSEGLGQLLRLSEEALIARRKERVRRFLVVGILALAFLTVAALAMSSWAWTAKTRSEFFAASANASVRAQRDPSDGLAILVKAVEAAKSGRVAVSIQDEAERSLRHILGNTHYRGTLGALNCEATDLDFSRDGLHVAIVAQDGSAELWYIGQPGVPYDDRRLATLPPDKRTGEVRVQRVNRICFDDQDEAGSRLIVVTGDPTGNAKETHGSARIWTPLAQKKDEQVMHLDVGGAPVAEAAFSSDGLRVALAIARGAGPDGSDGQVRVYDTRTGHQVGQSRKLDGPANCVSFHQSGILAAASGEMDADKRSVKGTVKVWKLEPGPGGLNLAEVSQINGYDRPASHAVFSPGGDLVAAGCRDGSVRVFLADSGEVIATLQGHTQQVVSLEFSRDGSKLVTASGDRTARVWEAGRWLARRGQEWQCLATLSGHSSSVFDAHFSSDGALVLTASYDRTVRIWDAVTGQDLVTCVGHQGPVYTARFSHDGSLFASASGDKTVRVWEVKLVDRPRQSFTGHRAAVRDVAFDPRGPRQERASDGSIRLRRRVATASADGTAILWDAVDRPPDPRRRSPSQYEASKPVVVRKFEGHSAALTSLSFSPDGQQLATASADGTVRVWSVESGSGQTLHGPGFPALGVTFGHSGRFILSSWADGKMRLHVRRADGSFMESRSWYGSSYRLHRGMFSGDDAVVVTPNAGLMRVKGSTGTVEAWSLSDARSPRLLASLEGLQSPCNDAAIGPGPDGAMLLAAALSAGQEGGELKLWAWQDRLGRSLASIRHLVGIERVAFHPSGRQLATEAEDGIGRIWSLPVPKAGPSGFVPPLRELTGLTGPVANLAYLPDGSALVTDGGGRLATDDGDTPIRIWNEKGTQDPVSLAGPRIPALAFGFRVGNPTQVVTIGRENDLRRWDVRWDPTSHRLVNLRRGPSFVATAAALSPDTNRAVTGADDGTIQVWDTRSGNKLAELVGHSARVTAAAFSPDGSLIVAAGLDPKKDGRSKMFVWDLSDGNAQRREPVASLSPAGDYVNSLRFHAGSGQRVIVAATGDLKRKRVQPRGPDHEDRALASVVRTAAGDETLIAPIDGVLSRSSSTSDDAAFGVNATAVSRDGSRVYLACGGLVPESHCMVRVYDLAKGKWLDPLTLVGHTEPVLDVALSPDESLVVTTSADNTARVWDAARRKPTVELKEHNGDVIRADFGPDGRHIATMSRQDGTVRLWDVTTGERLYLFASRRASVNSATINDASGPRSFTDDASNFAFSPEADSRTVVTAHGDGRARVYRLWLLGGLDELVQTARMRMTPESSTSQPKNLSTSE